LLRKTRIYFYKVPPKILSPQALMFKKTIRLDYYTFRNKLTPDTIVDGSIAIANNVLPLPIWSKDYYHLFLSIPEKKEVDTQFLLSVLQGKDKHIVLPKMHGQHALEHFLLTDNTRIKKNSWNVPEPMDGIPISESKVDVVFIPLLAFDRRGNRVGYGKGYYDNFLRKCRSDVIKVGLSFPIETISDVSQYDIPLDYCVTPKKTYAF